eukprot:TRINITY_DN7272_c0_g2_i2.p1 TRINITY_DN7272_c0_g2~~TRINITY_DN7272_c0_g2_i2.p1  ORF type:complete len:687 (+),score=189.55 TRINITY_DN7272_c0_g2_i2:275-2062(+)
MAVCECLREEEDLFRLVREVAEDASASGALWIEAAVSLVLYADRFGGLESTMAVLMRAAEVAEKVTGVGIAFIIPAERHLPPADAEQLAAAVKNIVTSGKAMINDHAGIVGFGLHSAEAGNPPEPFAKAIEIACKETGLACLPHAGEIAPSPGAGPASVKFCVEHMGARRIAHGVLAAEDPALLRELAEKKVCLDVCPTSNYLLRVCDSLAQHQLPTLLKAGVPCTINSDDPLLFGSSLVEEFEACRASLGLSDEDLAACARASFEHSHAPDDLKKKGVAGVDAWLASVEALKPLLVKPVNVVEAPAITITEYFGHVAAGLGTASLAIADVRQAAEEAFQTPLFDEYVICNSGLIEFVFNGDSRMRLSPGQGLFLPKNVRVKWIWLEPSKYTVLCLPAFSPLLCGREAEEGSTVAKDSASMKKLEELHAGKHEGEKADRNGAAAAEAVIVKPVAVVDAPGITITECFGHVASQLSTASLAMAVVKGPSEEAWQAPHFDEYVICTEGSIEFLYADAARVKIVAGEGAFLPKGMRVKWIWPEATKYTVLCLPAFTPVWSGREAEESATVAKDSASMQRLEKLHEDTGARAQQSGGYN